jgi:hypothetical protein
MFYIFLKYTYEFDEIIKKLKYVPEFIPHLFDAIEFYYIVNSNQSGAEQKLLKIHFKKIRKSASIV